MFYIKKYKDFMIRRVFRVIAFFYLKQPRPLQAYLNYCSENIDYYKGMGDKLDNYRFIDKNTVKSHFEKLINRNIKIKNIGLTSGTTGTPGRFLRDIHSMAMEQYYQAQYFGWNDTYRVFFRGEKLFGADFKGDKIYRTVPFIREMYISAFHINDTTLGVLVEKLRKIRNKSLWAYPSSAYMLAEYCLKKGITLDFKVVAVSSEKLMDYQITAIEKAFGCRVKDWYGQAERAAALVRCEYGNYHEVENYSHIEYVKAEDSTWEIAGTTIHNRVMPLVRYNIHDLMELSEESCPCGHKGRNIVRIHGRLNSYIQLPNGRLHEAILTFLFKSMSDIVESQIIQKTDGNIVLKIVKASGYTDKNEIILINHVSETIPREMFTIEYVEHIERDKSGKFRYVVNDAIV